MSLELNYASLYKTLLPSRSRNEKNIELPKMLHNSGDTVWRARSLSRIFNDLETIPSRHWSLALRSPHFNFSGMRNARLFIHTGANRVEIH
ncbi:hypothetical protein CEXT_343981 [Caerostris extrusa]|uniref:Uncharacterized protein n=1 Tax=Caerostris extrusa TaxID=172846 RepID=A0AAV4VXF1_CAEEX|nr:hypothetical protein CEXT_343981 [Caerostris extrusa]